MRPQPPHSRPRASSSSSSSVVLHLVPQSAVVTDGHLIQDVVQLDVLDRLQHHQDTQATGAKEDETIPSSASSVWY